MVTSVFQLARLDLPVPDYSTLGRRRNLLQFNIPYRRAYGALNLLVDSTGIRFLGYDERQA
jgi:hypothetical protein